jgi:hypothetical protein
LKITGPDARSIEARAGELTSRPLAYVKEPGIYELEFAGLRQSLAFNAPARESTRPLATPDEVGALFALSEPQGEAIEDGRARREAAERGSSVWRFFLVAAFLLIIAELFVATRQRKAAEI